MTGKMDETFEEFKKPSGSGSSWRIFGFHLELLEKGIRHELTMCQLVEDNDFGFVKCFESHDRVPKDFRKRAKAVSVEFKKEKYAAVKAKPQATPKLLKQVPDLKAGKPKVYWNCDLLSHQEGS